MITLQAEKILKMGANTKNEETFLFEVPTKITRLEPVFIFEFKIDDFDKSKSLFNVALNPKLSDSHEASNLIKQYHFNSDGSFKFDLEQFEDYFIDGEIKLLDSESRQNFKSCFVSITYGNKEEALHFIKGKFQLSEKN